MAALEKGPFFASLAPLARLQHRFFVPGHKGNQAALPAFAGLLPFDLTEIEGADDLSCPAGALAESQRLMAQVYGSGATLYSASGSTSCIEAMLTLFCALRPGKPVLLARGCHGAAIRALAFIGAAPVWLPLEEGRLSPGVLRESLQANSAAAVYITSPDYYGTMQDVAALAAVCREADVPLLVDNAHGAYLHFLHPGCHPLALGAAATADSAHKTLPCLTPAALLHLRDDALAGQARSALNLYSSTSPSYPVLQSLDLCAAMLAKNPPDFDAVAVRFARVAAAASHLAQPCDDPLRLVLHPGAGGWAFTAVKGALAQADILPEYADGTRFVMMASPWNREADFALLEEVLAAFPQRQPLPEPVLPPLHLQQVCTPRQALFGKKRRVETKQAAGHVAASIEAACPPGVPVVVPGERVTKEAARRLLLGGILEMDVLE